MIRVFATVLGLRQQMFNSILSELGSMTHGIDQTSQNRVGE